MQRRCNVKSAHECRRSGLLLVSPSVTQKKRSCSDGKAAQTAGRTTRRTRPCCGPAPLEQLASAYPPTKKRQQFKSKAASLKFRGDKVAMQATPQTLTQHPEPKHKDNTETGRHPVPLGVPLRPARSAFLPTCTTQNTHPRATPQDHSPHQERSTCHFVSQAAVQLQSTEAASHTQIKQLRPLPPINYCMRSCVAGRSRWAHRPDVAPLVTHVPLDAQTEATICTPAGRCPPQAQPQGLPSWCSPPPIQLLGSTQHLPVRRLPLVTSLTARHHPQYQSRCRQNR